MEPENLLPRSQDPVIFTHSERDESSLYPPTLFL